MKTIQKTLLNILGVICLLAAQNAKAQTYYAIASTSEKTDNGREFRKILTHVFPVKFCKDQTVEISKAVNSTKAEDAIEKKFEEEYNYSLKRKDYWIANKQFVTVEIFETYNEASSAMKKFIAKYKDKKDDDQGDIGMIEIRLDCIK